MLSSMVRGQRRGGIFIDFNPDCLSTLVEGKQFALKLVHFNYLLYKSSPPGPLCHPHSGWEGVLLLSKFKKLHQFSC